MRANRCRVRAIRIRTHNQIASGPKIDCAADCIRLQRGVRSQRNVGGQELNCVRRVDVGHHVDIAGLCHINGANIGHCGSTDAVCFSHHATQHNFLVCTDGDRTARIRGQRTAVQTDWCSRRIVKLKRTDIQSHAGLVTPANHG